MTARAPNIPNLIPKWIVSAVHGGHAFFDRWHSRRTSYIRLMSLDDRLLDDIGLTRGDIWSAANGDFRKSAANSNSAEQDAA
jgi:uncharacterized protein YjiS (DUF1127 family)